MPRRQTWNHNSHFQPLLLRQLPVAATTALDIGCGDGTLAVALAERGLQVLAVDRDADEASKTRSLCVGLTVEVREVDFLQADLDSDRFDVVTALASLHHMPFEAAIVEAARVLKPGGRLFVLGICVDRSLRWDTASFLYNRVLRRVRGLDVMSSPATMPTATMAELDVLFARLLPGSRLTRHLLWRYSLIWDKP